MLQPLVMAAGDRDLHDLCYNELKTDIDRMCPGNVMATRMLFAITSSILSTFDISPPSDEAGNPIKLTPSMSSGVLS